MTRTQWVLRGLDWGVAAALLGLGVLHNALTPKLFPELGGPSFLFVGTGLAFMFLGLFNMARLRAGTWAVATLCLVCNALALAYGGVFYGHVDTLAGWIVALLLLSAAFAALDLRRVGRMLG